LWNATTGEQVRLVDEGTGWVRFVDFSPDGKQVFLGRETIEPKQFAFKGELKVYNAADGSLIKTMAAPGRVMCGALSSDAKTVAAAIDVEAGKPDDPFGGHEGTKVLAWDVVTGQQLASFDRPHKPANSLAFSPDGSELTLASQDKSLNRWDLHKAKEVPVVPPPAAEGRRGYYKSVYLPSASLYASGGMAIDRNTRTRIGELSLVNLANGSMLWKKDFEDARPWELAVSPDGKVLATYLEGFSSAGSKGINRLVIWSIPDKKELSSFELTDDAVRSLGFSRDGSRLVAGMEFGDGLVWKIASVSKKDE
jgi:WD40 repeat protein